MTDLPPNAIDPASRDEWRAWIELNHTRSGGVWLVSFKSSSAGHASSATRLSKRRCAVHPHAHGDDVAKSRTTVELRRAPKSQNEPGHRES